MEPLPSNFEELPQDVQDRLLNEALAFAEAELTANRDNLDDLSFAGDSNLPPGAAQAAAEVDRAALRMKSALDGTLQMIRRLRGDMNRNPTLITDANADQPTDAPLPFTKNTLYERI